MILKNFIVNLGSAFIVAQEGQLGLIGTTKVLTASLLEQAAAWAATPMGMITIAVASIFLISKAIDAFTTTTEEHREKLEELKSTYQSTTSELEKINSELETTRNRLDELNAIENKTFVEQDEYNNLVKQNDELERKKELLETLQKQQNKELNKKFVETFQSDIKNKGEYQTLESGSMTSRNIVMDAIFGATYSSLNSEEDYVENQFNQLSKLKSKLIKTSTKEDYDNIQKQIDTIEAYLLDRVEQFQKDTEGIDYISNPTTDYERQTNEALDYINSFYNKYNDIVNGKGAKNTLFDSLFGDNKEFSYLKDKFTQLAVNGKLDSSVIDGYDNLKSKLNEVGLSVEDVVGQFAALGRDKFSSSVDEITSSVANVKTNIDSLKTSLDDLYDVLGKVTNGQEISGKEVLDLITKYPELESHITTTTNGYKVNEKAIQNLIKQKVAQNKIEIEDSIKAAKAVLKAEGIKLDGYNGTTKGIISQIMAQIVMLQNDFNKNVGVAGGWSSSPQAKKADELTAKLNQIKEAEIQLNNYEKQLKYLDDTTRYNPSSSSSSKSSDPYAALKDSFENEFNALKHRREMNQISEKQYLNELEKLYKRYFSGNKDLLDEYWKYEEEVYAGRMKLLEEAEKKLEDVRSKVIDMIKQEKDAEKDLLKDKLDAFKKIQDARKEALNQQKDEQDYNETVAEKNKEISDITLELMYLDGDNSAWATKRKLQLEDDLGKKRKDLADFQADYNLQKQLDEIDKETEAKEDQYDNEIKKIEDFLDNQYALIDAANNRLNGMTNTTMNQLIEYNKKYGSGIRDDIVSAWNEAKQALLDYGNASNFGGSLSGIQNKINSSVAPSGGSSSNASTSTNSANSSTISSTTLKIGDRVKSVAIGNSQSSGNGGVAKSGLNDLRIDKIFSGSKYPYRVTRNGVYMGFYTANALQRYHTGGIVSANGKISNEFMKLFELKPNEVPLIAEEGEAMVTRSRQNTFMKKTLPAIINNANSNGGDINISMGDIIIQGDTDENTISKIKKAQSEMRDSILNDINNKLFNKGHKRSPSF